MAKARNMIIDGYKKGSQLQMDKYGIFYIFNGRNPLTAAQIESYEILTEETSKDVVSTVGRGLLGSAIFGFAGTSASLTGKENKIYTIRVNYDDYDYLNHTVRKNKKGYSILELDQEFYKMFMLKCVRTEEERKRMAKAKIPSKYDYDYKKWLESNNLQDDFSHETQEFWDAFKEGNDPDTNPILDCCRSVNPKWEEYMKAQEQTRPTNITSFDTTDIKSKLKELKSMYEEDLITEEEYNSKRQELLNKM